MNNMELWNKVCVTDTRNTKKVTFGRSFTAIDAMSQMQVATEQFGTCGIGWGIKNEIYDFSSVPQTLVYRADLYYFIDGKEGVIPITSMIALYGKNGKIDEDATKKCSTDAKTKGLSFLGFNADIFLGKYDDNKYVQDLKMKEAVADKQKELENKSNQTKTPQNVSAPDKSVSNKLIDLLKENKITNMKDFAATFNISTKEPAKLEGYFDKGVIEPYIWFYKGVTENGVLDVLSIIKTLKFSSNKIVDLGKSYHEAKVKKGTDLIEACSLFKQTNSGK